MIFQRNASKTSTVFFRKSKYLLSTICKFKSIFRKQALFKPNLFGKFYSILNFISDDRQYVFFFKQIFVQVQEYLKKKMKIFNTEEFYILCAI